ncbi:lipid phosphate phosphatase gamma, chloroplastic-like protein [Cinnamomum micranthum f. kanehirae]|uniref:Lipid phosphate phosphatase gamma, chloroplastic-like protein n=1 Tax=Cinnamomum micranthum f. kanehirae TaxID=337451 RepID=A0A3S3P981_9MAGN|nr:lipid phosphate phosphatase gamma, chloroplastic-like protein [Cinnamomum micranthum f. kanehirae]
MAGTAIHGLKSVTLTHVRYHRGDRLGHFLAWVSLVPVFISLAGFLPHFLFRRELQAMCFALGLLLSQLIGELIKSFVQQPRPLHTCAALESCDSHGWPSSHSQYVFFFASYFTLLTFSAPVSASPPSRRSSSSPPYPGLSPSSPCTLEFTWGTTPSARSSLAPPSGCFSAQFGIGLLIHICTGIFL